MLILYEIALSPFVQKIKIALREKDIDFENRLAFSPEHREEFERVCQRQEVPALVDGDAAIFDSTVILDYIEERWPEPSLMPKSPEERAEVRMLEELCDTQLEALNFCLSEMVAFPPNNDDAASTVVERGQLELRAIFDYLEKKLGTADYFGGDCFSRADISILPHLNTAKVMKNGPNSKNLTAWLERVNNRASVLATIAEVKEAMPIFKDMMIRIRTGKEKRHYRDHRLDCLLRSGGSPILFDRIADGSVRFPPSFS